MLNKFFCFRLNTAATIIGWLGAVLSLVAIIIFGFCLGYLDDIVKAIVEQAAKDANKDEESIRKLLTIVFVAYLAMNAINLVASILLVMGTVKERHLLLLPWLVNSGISLLFSFIYYLYMLIVATQVAFSSGVALMITVSLSLGFHTYVWLAIYSLFKNIQRNVDQQQQPLRPAGATYPSYTKI